jgi:hypothetical protein
MAGPAASALHGWMRLLGVLLGCLHRRGDLPGAGRPTRDQTDPLPPGPPGTLIRVTPISGLSVLPNSRAWAFLYHSRDFDGHDVAVSGVVVAPPGAAPPQRRPVLVWAHGSVGLADRCAPSRGRVVMLAGHSVGGHAVLWAAELARSYAPELQVLGMATTAPGAELATILKLARFRPAAITSGAMLIVAAWSDAYRVPPDVLTPAGRKALDRVRTTCLQELASDPATPVVRPGNLLTTPPWPALLARNTPGRAATPATP